MNEAMTMLLDEAEGAVAALPESVDIDALLREAEAALDAQKEKEREMLSKLSSALGDMLRSAETARQASGIEKLWAYADAVSISEDAAPEAAANWYKPAGPEGRPIFKSQGGADGAGPSRAFINVTNPPVQFAAWAMKEMAMPEPDQFWELAPSPETEATRLIAQGEALQSEELLQAAIPMVEAENQALKRLESRLKDLLAESAIGLDTLSERFFDEYEHRGTAVLGPPELEETPAGPRPTVRVVPADTLWPDPACGRDIRNGSFVFEGPETFSRRQLLEFHAVGEEAGWFPEPLAEILEEEAKDGYKFWYFYGVLPVKDLVCEETGVNLLGAEGAAGPHVWVQATVCRSGAEGPLRVVRTAPQTVQGEIPFYAEVRDGRHWKRKDGLRLVDYWAGIPMPWTLKPIQTTVNVNWRSNDDNTQLSAVPMIARMKGVVKPSDGVWTFSPGKVWDVEIGTGDINADVRSVEAAFKSIDIPCRLADIRENLPLALSFIAHVTGLDDIVRGVGQGQGLGMVQLQMNTSSHIAKKGARAWKRAFVAMIGMLKRYLEQYEGIVAPADVVVKPPPPTVVRDIQANALVNALGMAANPAYGVDPGVFFQDWLRANSFDPSRYALTPERQKELAKLAAPPPDEKAAAMDRDSERRAQADVAEAKMETDAKRFQTEMRAESEARDRAHDQKMLELKYRLELVKYAAQKGIDVKAAQAQLEAVEVPRIEAEESVRGTGQSEM